MFQDNSYDFYVRSIFSTFKKSYETLNGYVFILWRTTALASSYGNYLGQVSYSTLSTSNFHHWASIIIYYCYS